MSNSASKESPISTDNFKTVTSATLKAMACDGDLDIVYSAAQPATGKKPLSMTQARLPDPSKTDKALIRGIADMQALHFCHHNDKLYRRHAPLNLEARAIFDALEQARCEAIGVNTMEGVARNLEVLTNEKCRAMDYTHAENRDDIAIADALHILTRARLTGREVPEQAKAIETLWGPWLDEHLSSHDLNALKNALHDQSTFAQNALGVIKAMDMNIQPEETGDPGRDQTDSDQNSDQEQQDTAQGEDEQDPPPATEDEDGMPGMEGMDEQDSPPDDGGEPTESGVEDDSNGMDTQLMGEEIASESTAERPIGYTQGREGSYQVFTTQFDEEVGAQDLADSFELDRLRDMLDSQLGHHQRIITKLANKLQRKLMAQQRYSWAFDQEEGTLDATRLARVIANPNVPLTFKKEHEAPFRDTVISLLIDNSGSMRGRPIAIAAMTTDILARTLERCGLKVEILGFTTRAWKGGQARDLWTQAGRPSMPGRLNDLRHIIYKAADAPWRRSRKNLGLMLKEGILKENIDGEALVWAYNRLAVRPEARKILMVISDGAPVDDSTLSVNPSNILEEDLANIIQWIERDSVVELAAIGIGHDVTRYYQNALTISDADELANALVTQLADLFTES